MRKGVHSMAMRGAERGRTAGKVSRERERAEQQRGRQIARQSPQETRGCNRITQPKSCPSPATGNTSHLRKSQLNRWGKKKKTATTRRESQVTWQKVRQEEGTGTDVALAGQRRGSSAGARAAPGAAGRCRGEPGGQGASRCGGGGWPYTAAEGCKNTPTPMRIRRATRR